MADERKYFVKMNYRFNLDSMMTHIWCLIYDMQDGVIKGKVNLLGKDYDEDGLYELIDEIGELLSAAMCGKVTGKQYGRIKAISDERNLIRYATCLAKGMSEDKAAYAFFD